MFVFDDLFDYLFGRENEEQKAHRMKEESIACFTKELLFYVTISEEEASKLCRYLVSDCNIRSCYSLAERVAQNDGDNSIIVLSGVLPATVELICSTIDEHMYCEKVLSRVYLP